jgi:hypothetical protein
MATAGSETRHEIGVSLQAAFSQNQYVLTANYEEVIGMIAKPCLPMMEAITESGHQLPFLSPLQT